MKKSGWIARLAYGAVLAALFFGHKHAMTNVPNDELGRTILFGSAAFGDWMAVKCACYFTEGRLCDDMEMLGYISIAANLAGWIAWLSWLPSVYYVTFQIGHSLIQAIRLLLLDGDNVADTGWIRHILRLTPGRT